MSNDFVRAVDLFARARRLSPDERAPFLDAQCAGDELLRAEVEQLLAADPGDSALDSIAARTRSDDSVIARIATHADGMPNVRLHDPAGDDAPATDGSAIGKYLLGERLGAGGMSEVLRGRDRDLNRDVALKFLRDRHRDNPGIVRRFVEEAQIGGQLQHPGIVPVYDLGLSDGMPFFAMKLVKGQSLGDLLAARASPADERQRFLQVFLQVCQAVAFAHARGVIHRDLKPHNVMVGRYGEVQVVDWGMGKVVDRGDEPPRPEGRGELAASVVHTERSDTPGSDSMPGSVLGTPAYMSPEQALGEVDRVGKGADVFGLGAVLCEVLTGAPPYESDEPDPRKRQHALLVMAARPKLGDAWSRLERCGAELEVVALCRECLAAEVDDRPPDAEVVAKRVADHLARVEARAQQARVAAAVSRQRQRLLTLIVAIVVAGLGATGWLWLLADGRADEIARQKSIADQQKAVVEQQKATVEQQKATVEQERNNATAANRRFRLVGWRSRLDQAKADAEELVPAWPHNISRLRSWIDGARTIATALDEVRAARDELREEASPPTTEDTAAVQAYLEREVEPRKKQLAALRLAQSVRAGATLEVPTLDEETKGKPFEELNTIVWERIGQGGEYRKIYGEEPHALAVARQMVAAARALPVTDEQLAILLDSLAWANLACGLDDRARQCLDDALALAGDSRRAETEGYRRLLEQRIAAACGDAGRRAIEQLEAEIARHEERATDERRWMCTNDSARFLHRTLQILVRDLEPFGGRHGMLDEVESRLFWAERIEDLSIGRHRARWAAAAVAIRAADGETASELYRSDPPLELEPQMGLVPIGMNPATQLWEFYHLRSAWDPESGIDPAAIEIPRHDPDGDIAVGDDTGIVFVLLPGGTFLMGAQSADEKMPNFDPLARPNETPHDKHIEPVFIARHEVTQGQWRRLTSGEVPSAYGAGLTVGRLITWHNPVEGVDWVSCMRLAEVFGLALPAESLWEYACRAGTTTPWSTGAELATLEGYANILDDTGHESMPSWGPSVGFDDKHAIHAPAGSFRPNAWGLHDMHGNVYEWTSTTWNLALRVRRGGTFAGAAQLSRSSNRDAMGPSARDPYLGVRFARPLRRDLRTAAGAAGR